MEYIIALALVFTILTETMNVPFKHTSKCEVYVVIYFLTEQNISTADIRKQLISVYGENIMSSQMVAERRGNFSKGDSRMTERSLDTLTECRNI